MLGITLWRINFKGEENHINQTTKILYKHCELSKTLTQEYNFFVILCFPREACGLYHLPSRKLRSNWLIGI